MSRQEFFRADELGNTMRLISFITNHWERKTNPTQTCVRRSSLLWDRTLRLCRVREVKGKSMHSMGITYRGEGLPRGKKSCVCLYPEEAVFLMRAGKADVYDDEREGDAAEEDRKRSDDEIDRSFKRMTMNDVYTRLLPQTKTPMEFFFAYCYFKDNGFVARRRFEGPPELLSFDRIKDAKRLTLADIRSSAFDIWPPNSHFGRVASLRRDPEFLCFVCAHDARPPFPSELAEIVRVCGNIRVKIAAVDLFGSVLLYDITPVPSHNAVSS